MVKKVPILLILAFIGINLNSQENDFIFKPFFGGGGATATFASAGNYGVGGYGEFAFLFYDKGLQISNHFIGRGDSITVNSDNKYGSGSLITKISFSGYLQKEFLRSYTFIEGGIGFGGGDNSFAYNLIFGGGGGIDLFYHKTGSVYLEAGYLQHYVNNELIGGITLSIGTRGYINR
jgi:hypothetical protein